ncbi:MAG: hypothetical protein ABIP10_13405 [Ferruginibacter sp.]
MAKGVIIHLDNDKEKILEPSKHFFDQLGCPLDYICCNTVEDFNKKISENAPLLKAVIFDLLEKDEEIKDYKKSPFNDAIIETFKSFNVPVFIYSGYLTDFVDFKYNGTVIKIDKGNELGFKAVSDKIILFHDSGFLDIFCRNGLLEQLLHKELHEAFTTQFPKDNDIENIIQAIKISGQDLSTRTQEVFSRIALRSLMAHLMIDKTIQDEQFDEAKISAVELYVRRLNTDKTPVWTGDIFKIKGGKEKLLILTPRCDVASKGKESLLVCKISESTGDFKKADAMKYIRDNIAQKKFRYLPYTPLFEGGKVDLSEQQIITKVLLIEQYDYLISLTDDLTNEILAKLCAYLLRTSIPDVDEKELQAFLNNP